MREDDRPDRVELRLELFGQRAERLAAYYANRGVLKRVGAVGAEADVHRWIAAAIGADGESSIH